MLIENLTVAESNGVVTADFKSENCMVKMQIGLGKVISYRYSKELEKYNYSIMTEADFQELYIKVKCFIMEHLYISVDDYLTTNLTVAA